MSNSFLRSILIPLTNKIIARFSLAYFLAIDKKKGKFYENVWIYT